MKRYDEQVLHALLDKYEESLLYTEQNRRNMSISFPLKKRTLPEYFDESSGAYEVIHEQLAEAERAGYIRLVWKNKKPGHILEKCVLNPDRIGDIYACLKRAPKRERQNRMEEILTVYRDRGPVMERFCGWMLNRLEQGESVKRYATLDDPEGLERLCRLICGILENQEELYLREFSVRHFQDTKLAEREIGKAVEVIRRFAKEEETGEAETCDREIGVKETGVRETGARDAGTDRRLDGLEDLTTDQILEEFSIYRNPSWVMMKGTGRFYAGEDSIDLGHFSGGIGIHSGDLKRIRWDAGYADAGYVETGYVGSVGADKTGGNVEHAEQTRRNGAGVGLTRPVRRVLTIENLTTFHRMQGEDTLFIYLAGYHNRVKREFLMKLYEAFPQAEYLHFGDLDCGGFLIWKNLCRNTGIPFQAYRMDRETLENNLEYARPLTEYDRKTLKKMMADPFFAKQTEVFEEMLKLGRKVEQEAVGLGTWA